MTHSRMIFVSLSIKRGRLIATSKDLFPIFSRIVGSRYFHIFILTFLPEVLESRADEG